MKHFPIAALVLGCSLPSMADYVVDTDLGVLPLGDTVLVGTTAGGPNNSVFPKGIFTDGPENNWGTEFVYQFEISQIAIISLTSNADFSGDPDFFLLDGLATSIDLQSGKISADNAIDVAVLDGFSPETTSFAVLQPGVYFLAVESYIGPNGNVTPRDASFDVTLTVAEADAFDLEINLGHVAREGTPISFDTFGSLFDTELAIFDEFGALVEENDDAGGGVQSEIMFPAGLPAGGYYAVIAGRDTTFGPNFAVSGGGATGDWDFNFPLGPTFGPGLETGTTDPVSLATETQVFFFLISAPPFSVTDLGTVASADEAFAIDTVGSLFGDPLDPGQNDTQLAAYDSEGFFILFNDDIDFGGGDYLSSLDFSFGLPEGEYFLALTGYRNFFGDGFFAVVDPGSYGGDYMLNYPGGTLPGFLPVNSQEWFSFTIGSSGPVGIQVTDIEFNQATNQFTVSWESSLPGPFNIFVGDAADLGGIGPVPANVLPTLGVASVTSPATFTVPAPLQGEPQVFLQVTD